MFFVFTLSWAYKNSIMCSIFSVLFSSVLEIFANDVSCTHGATVGQLDEEALFYLATRGISHAQARDYLVRAFAHENINLVPDESVKQWIQELLGQTIGSFSDD